MLTFLYDVYDSITSYYYNVINIDNKVYESCFEKLLLLLLL